VEDYDVIIVVIAARRELKVFLPGSHPPVSKRRGRENVLYIHVTLVPFLKTSGEVMTKPISTVS
jgi:CTP synthase (UTP-ammonia lyase)